MEDYARGRERLVLYYLNNVSNIRRSGIITPNTKNCVREDIIVRRPVDGLLATGYIGGPVTRTLITIRVKTLGYIYRVRVYSSSHLYLSLILDRNNTI